MTLVTFAATTDWARYAIDTDNIADSRIVYRVSLVTWLDQIQKTGEPIHLADWTLNEDDITALLKYITRAAQDIRDAQLEKALERRADFQSNWS